MQNIDKIKQIHYFKCVTNKDNQYIEFLKTKIAPHITPNLAQNMLDFCLSPKIHSNILSQIKQQHLSPLTTNTTPTIHIILGQPGAGKSTLANHLLKIYTNTLLIDQDIYKPFHPLSSQILQYSPSYYGHLTGIDSHLFTQNILDTAIKNKYNILIQLAPTQKPFLDEINLNALLQNNYKINLHILAVSLPNILLSIHERYEDQLQNHYPTPKLTDLNRAINSHHSLQNWLNNLPFHNIHQTTIYVRNYSQNHQNPPFPTTITSLQSQTPLFQHIHTTPQELLHHFSTLQNYDLTQIIHSVPNRINTILHSMNTRQAPQSQQTQFKEIIQIIKSTPNPINIKK